jgi:flagellar protein FlbD
MIELTKLSKDKYYINPHLIETIELMPDTLITLSNGKKYYALESAQEVVEKIEDFFRRTSIIIRKTKKE